MHLQRHTSSLVVFASHGVRPCQAVPQSAGARTREYRIPRQDPDVCRVTSRPSAARARQRSNGPQHLRSQQQPWEQPHHLQSQQQRVDAHSAKVAALAHALHLPMEDVAAMMASYRRINGYSTASLAAKLEAIADMLELDGPGAAAKLVRHVPRVLGCSLEALEERVEGLAALLTQHDIRQFVQVLKHAPQLLSMRPELVKSKIYALSTLLGIIYEQALALMLQHPQLLRSTNSLQPALHELHRIMLHIPYDQQCSNTGSSSSSSSSMIDSGDAAGSAAQITMERQPAGSIDELVLHCPQLLCYSARTLAAKFVMLQQALGASPEQAARAVLTDPNTLLRMRI